eukprot:SAG11_NODE_36991_length_259_cov_0.575000_1_plen_66_part_10
MYNYASEVGSTYCVMAIWELRLFFSAPTCTGVLRTGMYWRFGCTGIIYRVQVCTESVVQVSFTVYG